MTTQPVKTWTDQRGRVVRVFETEEPFRFRVTFDDRPFDPVEQINPTK